MSWATLIGFGSMLVGAGSAQAAAPATVSEVNTAFQTFKTAWEHKDLAGATAVYTPDAVAYDPAPPGVFTTPAAIHDWVANSFRDFSTIAIDVSDVQTHVAGSVAWMTMHYDFKATMQGKPFNDAGNLSLVWVKQDDGTYKIAVFHGSSPPPPPPPEKKP